MHPNWVPYVAVADISKTVEKAEKLGAIVLMAPHKEIREGTSAILLDPTGAVFAVIQLKL